jgi:tRNA(Ile)-lysidine synthase
MHQFLESTAFRFFAERLDLAKPLLLGLSGGADSICLLHLLLIWKKSHPITLHLVHVDHGWREESAKEALELQRMAESYGLAFHTKRLDPSKYQGNLENESRRERLEFFTQVAQSVNAQGIVLGHHGDDQAETLLKRILEGAAITQLHGMLPVTTIGSLTIFRPLLNVTKKELLGWLESKEISFFTDETNSDIQYLRAKMRQLIFPFLQSSFGKNCAHNLIEIAEEAAEVKQHVEALLLPNLKKIVVSDLGYLLDVEFSGMDPFLLRCLVREVCRRAGFEIQRSECKRIRDALLRGEADVRVARKESTLISDRRRLLYIAKRPHLIKSEPKVLCIGQHQYEGWNITVTEVKDQKMLLQNFWKDVWQGECVTLLPKAKYHIAPMNMHLRRRVGTGSKVLGKLLQERRVPRSLADFVPLVLQDDVVVEDFLTATARKPEHGALLHIVMQRIR